MSPPLAADAHRARYIPAIDGMRAIAILVVVVAHLLKDGIIPGGLGVTLFFFISGYLITGLLIDEYETSGTIDIKYFYIRRFMRLAPALLTMVATVSLIYFAVFGVTSVKEILAAVFYFLNYYQIMHGAMLLPLAPLWSLAIEEHFYLVFPLVIALTWKFREKLFVSLVVVCALVLLWRMILVAGGAPDVRTYTGTDTRIDSIVYGALLSIGTRLKLDLGWLIRRPTLIAGVALLLASLIIRNPVFRETVRYSVQGIAFIPLFYYVISVDSPVKRALESPVAVWIGKLSYSLYLWHFPILIFTMMEFPAGNPTILGLLIAFLSLLCAAISYYFVETPLRLTGGTHSRRSSPGLIRSLDPPIER
jgi:peptidoglycan/LPS O-acetylase OafA/YrhL